MAGRRAKSTHELRRVVYPARSVTSRLRRDDRPTFFPPMCSVQTDANSKWLTESVSDQSHL